MCPSLSHILSRKLKPFLGSLRSCAFYQAASWFSLRKVLSIDLILSHVCLLYRYRLSFCSAIAVIGTVGSDWFSSFSEVLRLSLDPVLRLSSTRLFLFLRTPSFRIFLGLPWAFLSESVLPVTVVILGHSVEVVETSNSSSSLLSDFFPVCYSTSCTFLFHSSLRVSSIICFDVLSMLVTIAPFTFVFYGCRKPYPWLLSGSAHRPLLECRLVDLPSVCFHLSHVLSLSNHACFDSINFPILFHRTAAFATSFRHSSISIL